MNPRPCSVRLQAGTLQPRTMPAFRQALQYFLKVALQGGLFRIRTWRSERQKFLIVARPVFPSLRQEGAGRFQRQKRVVPCINIIVNCLVTSTRECESRFQDWLCSFLSDRKTMIKHAPPERGANICDEWRCRSMSVAVCGSVKLGSCPLLTRQSPDLGARSADR